MVGDGQLALAVDAPELDRDAACPPACAPARWPEVVEHLAESGRVAVTVAGSTESSIGRPGSTTRAASTASPTTRGEVDRLPLERPALVEAREQQQIVDEQAHPLGLARDAGHRPLEILGARGGAAAEQLGVGAHGGERRAQLVRRVGDEAAQRAGRRPRSGRASR